MKEIIENIKREILKDLERKIDALFSRCESPIEILFFANFYKYFYQLSFMGGELSFITELIHPELDNLDKFLLQHIHSDKFGNTGAMLGFRYRESSLCYEVYPQYEIQLKENLYRLDLAIFFKRIMPGKNSQIGKRICIECDGHEFHEKSKAQVIRDNKRTRNLKANGWEVLRYSGSELYQKRDFTEFNELINELNKIIHADWRLDRE